MIKNKQDFFSGIFFSVVGYSFCIAAKSYDFGSASKLGPGAFPFYVGLILGSIGVYFLISSTTFKRCENKDIEGISYRPLFFIISANFIFGIILNGNYFLGIPAMGLLLSVFLLLFIASFAMKGYGMKNRLLMSLVLTALSYLVFVCLLDINFQIFPDFIEFSE